MSPDENNGSNYRIFRSFTILVGVVLVVIGFASLMSSFWAGSGPSQVFAGFICGGLGIVLIIVATRDDAWLNDGPSLYINTFEGTVFASLTVCLSFLSFITIIDRTPTVFGLESSPEGLFVAPEAVLFPVEINLSVLGYAVAVSVILVVLGRTGAQFVPKSPSELLYTECRAVLFVLLMALIFVLLPLDLGIPGGIEIEGRTLRTTPLTGWITLAIMWALLVIPIPIFTLPLLPEWVNGDEVDVSNQREWLEDHIASNWRRTRTLTTLTLTGAVGVALSFVFSRATPNFFFVLAIVGSVTIGPMGVVWFLMRRIREAEKELRPTPP
jgi:hypothetical protein